jgi:hypothetical protein
MTTDLSNPHRALALRHGCRDAHSANSALGHRNDPVWRVGVLRTVRYRRAAARAMVGAVGRFPSSSARTMRRYCHASAATPSSRSAIASAPESRLKHPVHVPNTGRVRFQVSSELRRYLIGGRNRQGSRCRSGKDVASVVTALSSTAPSRRLTVIARRGVADGRIPGIPEARWPQHGRSTLRRYLMTWIGRNQGCYYWARVRKRVSGRDLNPYGGDLR